MGLSAVAGSSTALGSEIFTAVSMLILDATLSSTFGEKGSADTLSRELSSRELSNQEHSALKESDACTKVDGC